MCGGATDPTNSKPDGGVRVKTGRSLQELYQIKEDPSDAWRSEGKL